MMSKDHFSPDPQLNRLLEKVVAEVRLFAEKQLRHIHKRVEIGIALSAEKDVNKIFEMIVDEAKVITGADGGTLYIVDEREQFLNFVILHNDSLKIKLGGTSGKKIDLPPVPLKKNGKPNHTHVSAYAALTGKVVNIPDVYQAEGFDFTGPREYDKRTGYRSKSMLVIPMRNHENDTIGVLQLLNARDRNSNEVVPFKAEQMDFVKSLAYQAAVALENAQLFQELKKLFESFIKSIATTIDEKSPYTGGHIRRVVDLTMLIANEICRTADGPFAGTQLSPDEMEELRIATWMHDIGKITTPEHVVDKATKLEGVFDRIHLIDLRFNLIQTAAENEFLKKRLKLLENGNPDSRALQQLEEEFNEKIKTLQMEKAFVLKCNQPAEKMSEDKLDLLERIARKTYMVNGQPRPYLTPDELRNLSIMRGTLTPEERKIIENHALMTIKILNQLPFPKKLANVPEYAGGHHERLDGSGYPFGLTKSKLPLQARIMAVADIFESLTAKDRPYKRPMKLSQALEILKKMKDDQHIDADIYDLFVGRKLYKKYADRELNPEQVDL